MSATTEGGREAPVGLRVAVAVRLTVSYALSLVVGGMLTGRVMFPIAGALLSWPLYLVAVIVTIVFAKSILAHPATWSAAAVFVASAASVFTLPFAWHFLSVATVGVFCAVVAGVTFYYWNRCFPLN